MYVDDLTPRSVRNMDFKEVKKMYSRLRKVANKRVDRLLSSEFSNGRVAQLYGGGFAKIADLSKQDLIYELIDVKHFLSLKTSTIKGNKEVESRILGSLHEDSYDFITKDNLRDYGDFMDAVRDGIKGRVYDSESAYTYYEKARQTAKGGKLSPQELAKRYKKYKALKGVDKD